LLVLINNTALSSPPHYLHSTLLETIVSQEALIHGDEYISLSRIMALIYILKPGAESESTLQISILFARSRDIVIRCLKRTEEACGILN
jgi:hypothetical protein